MSLANLIVIVLFIVRCRFDEYTTNVQEHGGFYYVSGMRRGTGDVDYN